MRPKPLRALALLLVPMAASAGVGSVRPGGAPVGAGESSVAIVRACCCGDSCGAACSCCAPEPADRSGGEGEPKTPAGKCGGKSETSAPPPDQPSDLPPERALPESAPRGFPIAPNSTDPGTTRANPLRSRGPPEFPIR